MGFFSDIVEAIPFNPLPKNRKTGGFQYIPEADARIEEQARQEAEMKRLAEIKSQREKSLSQLQQSEAEAKGIMLQKTGEAGAAIDRQLSQLLSETGYLGGLARQSIGEQQASSGLLRSGLTSERLAAQRLGEEKAKGIAKTQAEQQKSDLQQQTIEAQKNVTEQRKEIQNRLTDLEVQGLSSARYQAEAESLQDDFKKFIDNLKMSSESKQALYSSLGGVATLAGLGIGYAVSNKSTSAPGAASTSQIGGYNQTNQIA